MGTAHRIVSLALVQDYILPCSFRCAKNIILSKRKTVNDSSFSSALMMEKLNHIALGIRSLSRIDNDF